MELILEAAEEAPGTETFSRAAILSGVSETDTKKTHVFISSSRKNIEFVRSLHRELSEANFKVWVDWESIPLSADWWAEIEGAIRSADAFVFVISPDSLKSEVCEKELAKAVELNKNIVPIMRIEPARGVAIPERLSGDEEGKVIVWDLRLATPQVVLAFHDGPVYTVDWSPAGVLASAGEDRTIILRDLFREEPDMRLTGHTGAIRQIAWSADGRLASASEDGTVILWNLETGQPGVTLRGHTAAVNSLAWDPTGRLLTASDDGTVISWNVETGAVRRVLKGHIEEAITVAWRPDGAYFASGGGDNLIRVLPDKFLSPPCTWGVRNINPGGEWDFYFPGQDYRATCDGRRRTLNTKAAVDRQPLLKNEEEKQTREY